MNIETEEMMLDLLCKQAVYGLNDEETQQLEKLQRMAGPRFNGESFELTAAAISLAGLDTKAELPRNLRSRIAAEAERYFDEKNGTAETAGRIQINDKAKGSSFVNWLGWAVAVAACVALAANLYLTGVERQNARNNDLTPAPEEKLTPARQREQLMETAPDLARASWGAGKMAELKPAGDVVWSDARQTGYVRLTGLPKNDPNKETYQLWIVAENQDPKTPVDGGTFDVNADGEMIIPISAKVRVQNPQAFAITVEKPGGVVVSKQDKVAALAKIETGSKAAA